MCGIFCTICRSEILAITSDLYPCQSPGEAADCCKVDSTHAQTYIQKCTTYGRHDDDDDDDEMGVIVEHVIAGCSSLSESAYLGRHRQLAKMIHKQIATKYKLFNRNTLPYYRYRPKLLLDQLT